MEFGTKQLTTGQRLTAETIGSDERRTLVISLDGKIAGGVKEWQGAWYAYDHIDDLSGPKFGAIKIADSPEEALKWWIRRRGFEEA